MPLAEVTREMRARAKAVNFGIIYGQTAFGLSQTTGMSRGEAQTFIDTYFAPLPPHSQLHQSVHLGRQNATAACGQSRGDTGRSAISTHGIA